MENLLCDELLQEIFHRLPSSSSSSSSISLVSKRWLNLYRASKFSLSLNLSLNNFTIHGFSSFLSHFPFLSSLYIFVSADSSAAATVNFPDRILVVVSSFCPNLKTLNFLAGPVSVSSLISLSEKCVYITSLTIYLSRPLFLKWVVDFHSLKELSILVSSLEGFEEENGFWGNEDLEADLGLESLCLSGIGAYDWGMGWFWRSCKKLRKLQLRNCEGIGDGGSLSSFVNCLSGLEDVEIRTCRSVVNGLLFKLAENCNSLNSLLLYDGGSREGLLHFISHCKCDLQKLDLRLPLDLNNDHLLAAAMSFSSLSTLRLQSCCLVTGQGLKAIGVARSFQLEELALVNCDVVEREPGLLATLGQNLKVLRKLDLSYNEMLFDKELISMLVSCNHLIDLRLRGCKGLTNTTMIAMLKGCKNLESVDIMHCCGIEVDGVELFVLNSPRLRQIQVEESKLSNVAKTRASRQCIEVIL